MSTLHEGSGHGLYELGGDPAHARDALHRVASLSQRVAVSGEMWENLIGRIDAILATVLSSSSESLSFSIGKRISLSINATCLNKVELFSKSVLEVDEATYNLHIMLRLEIEMGLLEGTIKVADLPEYWNSKGAQNTLALHRKTMRKMSFEMYTGQMA